MGLIFSRFYDKPSTRATLEKIEQEIQNIEERRWDEIKREHFFLQILSFIPITILLAVACILIYPSDTSFRDKLAFCMPFMLLNLLLFVCRRCIQWYSRYLLANEEARLRKLQKEKKKILEMVCETESYRVASELLEKYDPRQLRRRERALSPARSPKPNVNTSLTKITASPLRTTSQLNTTAQLNQAQNMSFLNQSMNLPKPQILPTPAPPPPTPVANMNRLSLAANPTVQQSLNASVSAPVIATSSVQGRPVRPILSKERTLIERMVDWVVADGPDNRFALICRYCYGHNGMSLAEEYETLNFRCCYCYNLNTTTNKRRQVHDQLQPEREKSATLETNELSEANKTAVSDNGAELDITQKQSEVNDACDKVEDNSLDSDSDKQLDDTRAKDNEEGDVKKLDQE